jgi:hypothetical protein
MDALKMTLPSDYSSCPLEEGQKGCQAGLEHYPYFLLYQVPITF